MNHIACPATRIIQVCLRSSGRLVNLRTEPSQASGQSY